MLRARVDDMLPTRLWKILLWFAETFHGACFGVLVHTQEKCHRRVQKVTSLIYLYTVRSTVKIIIHSDAEEA
jgi:hypothetical protein